MSLMLFICILIISFALTPDDVIKAAIDKISQIQNNTKLTFNSTKFGAVLNPPLAVFGNKCITIYYEGWTRRHTFGWLLPLSWLDSSCQYRTNITYLGIGNESDPATTIIASDPRFIVHKLSKTRSIFYIVNTYFVGTKPRLFLKTYELVTDEISREKVLRNNNTLLLGRFQKVHRFTVVEFLPNAPII